MGRVLDGLMVATGDVAVSARALGVGVIGGFVGGTVGGGIGLISVPLIVLVLGFPIHLAIGTNLFQSIFTGASGVYQHYRRGNIALGLSTPLVAGAVVGAPLGAIVSLRLPATVLEGVFTVILLGLAAKLVWDLVGPETTEDPGEQATLADRLDDGHGPIDQASRQLIGDPATDAVRDALTTPIEGEHKGQAYALDRITPVLLGSAVGFAAGLLGIGGGSLLVASMSTLASIPTHLAVGTGLIVVSGNAMAGSIPP